MKIPARRAEYSLTENVASPFQAEPRQFELDAPGGNTGLTPEAFFRSVVAEVSTIPGVSSASAAASSPLTGDAIVSSIEIEGHPEALGSRPAANFNAVEPHYFYTVGVKLVEGRDFTEHDSSKSIPVAIVNRTLAQRFFAGQDPIGKHVALMACYLPVRRAANVDPMLSLRHE